MREHPPSFAQSQAHTLRRQEITESVTYYHVMLADEGEVGFVVKDGNRWRARVRETAFGEPTGRFPLLGEYRTRREAVDEVLIEWPRW